MQHEHELVPDAAAIVAEEVKLLRRDFDVREYLRGEEVLERKVVMVANVAPTLLWLANVAGRRSVGTFGELRGA